MVGISTRKPLFYLLFGFALVACPARFERATYALEGRCSIQLSYGQMETRIAGLKNHGRGERIRTFDPLLPKQMRYQAALRPDKVAILHGRSNFT